MSEFSLQNRIEAEISPEEQRALTEIMSYLGDERKLVIGEFPPIYAFHGFPGAEHPGQNPAHPAINAGLNLGMKLHSRLFRNPNIRWFHMVDDKNGNCMKGKTQFEQILQAYSDPEVSREGSDIVYLESEFHSLSTSTCAQMDALFQMEKISAAIGTHSFDGAIQNCCFLVIHPNSFVYTENPNAVKRSQQETMLGNLANNLTTHIHQNNLYTLPESTPQKGIKLARLNQARETATKFITNTYRWITYDDSGNLSGFAQARWNGKRFGIERCESLNLINEDSLVLQKAV